MDADAQGSPWRVVVIDDHELLSSALGIAFSADGRAQVVATAGTLDAGIRAVEQHEPDVVLSDRRLPDGDAEQHLEALVSAHPGTRVLLMTGWPTPRSSLAALRGGARGVVSKMEPVEEIVDAVVRVARGELIVPADVADQVFGSTRPAERAALSPRELDVLEALSTGRSTAEAAEALFMSRHTLRNHLSRAMLKLGVHDRLAAVAEAIRLGLISPQLPAARPPATRSER